MRKWYACFQPIAAEENDAGGSAIPEIGAGLENVDTAMVDSLSSANFSNNEVEIYDESKFGIPRNFQILPVENKKMTIEKHWRKMFVGD